MSKKIHTCDSDLWALDTEDCSDIKFHGYEIVLKEKWVCPHESEDSSCSRPYRLTDTVDIISLSRTLVPAYMIDIIKSMLNIVLMQFPSSENRYEITAYHVGYCRCRTEKGDYGKRHRKVLYHKDGMVGGRNYESGIIGWDDNNRRIVTEDA